jgi:hypothetical protein
VLLHLPDLAAARLGLLVLAFLHQRADGAAGGVARGVELVGFRNHAAALGVGPREVVERRGRELARFECGAHLI